jgi:ATP/maltotriose-dependent transcriptional regulator MalT
MMEVLQYLFRLLSTMETQWKVDIKPSYEWSEKAKEIGVSHRELEVLALVVEGYKNKEIAQVSKVELC